MRGADHQLHAAQAAAHEVAQENSGMSLPPKGRWTPSTSCGPSMLTPTAMVTATDTMRPTSRTFRYVASIQTRDSRRRSWRHGIFLWSGSCQQPDPTENSSKDRRALEGVLQRLIVGADAKSVTRSYASPGDVTRGGSTTANSALASAELLSGCLELS